MSDVVSDPAVVRVLREFREGLGAMETSVMEDMGRRWLQVEARLKSDMQALEAVVLRLTEDGKPLTTQILYKQEAYLRLGDGLRREIAKYDEYLNPMVVEKQVAFGELGVQAATQAIRASYTTVIAPYFPILNRGAVEAMAGFLADGSPLSTVLKKVYPKAMDGLGQALINGIARGLGVGQVAQEMAVGMSGGLDHALLIARTEMNRSYRAASIAQYRESRVVDGFYRLVKKSTACVACLMMDGEYLASKDDLHDHPAGKCQAVPKVKGIGAPVWERGREYFENLSPEEQMVRMGPERFKLWQEGRFDLSDLARKSHSEVWGDQPRAATVAELIGGL